MNQMIEFLVWVGAGALIVALLLAVGFACCLAVPARDSDDPVREALHEIGEMFGLR